MENGTLDPDAQRQSRSDDGEDAEAHAQNTPEKSVVLVVHASVGSGHRSAACAIAHALEVLRDDNEDDDSRKVLVPADLDVRTLDILDFGRIAFDGDATASMFTGATRPIYDLTWRYTFTGRLLWGGGTIWAYLMFPKFVEYVRTERPIAIICTHITAANVAVGARMITDYDFPIVCVPTDYEVEGLWPHRHVDLFCTANEYMAESLRPRKVPESRIAITGIPVHPSFSASYNRETVRSELEIPEDRIVVLTLAGARLPRPYVRFRELIDQLVPCFGSFEKMHMVIVAGKDAEYAHHLRGLVEECKLGNVTVLDYVDNMAALMHASDLVLCKAGGLTVTECLCASIPMILVGRSYGQEKANMHMLTAGGAALHVTTVRELITALRHVEKRPDSMRVMLINASFMRKPEAAHDIAVETLKLVGKPPSSRQIARKKRLYHLYWGKKPAHIR